MKKNILLIFVFSSISLLSVFLYADKIRGTNFPYKASILYRTSSLLLKIAHYLEPVNPFTEQLIQNKNQLLTERKHMILRDLGLSFEDQHDLYTIARELRDKIYENNWKSIKQASRTPMDPHIKYNYIFDNRFFFTCGSLSVVYRWALEPFNIPSRSVQLAAKSFLEGNNIYETHVVVEIFDGVKWFVSDPTFNAEFHCSDGGDPLSIKEMKICLSKGNTLVPKYGKAMVPNGKRVETYNPSYEDLLYAYSLSPTVIGDNSIPIEEYPFPGWIQKSIKKFQSPEKVGRN